jgi:uncharacterized membrane protein (DUF106 family)
MDVINAALAAIFGPLMGMQSMLSLTAISVVVTFLITLVYRFLGDPKKMKELKDRAKEISAKVKEVQKTSPDEAKTLTNEMLELTNKQMMASFKPMVATLLVAALTLPWMAAHFVGPIVKLPADVPMLGSSMGWLVWYILISIPASQILRKVVGVDL